MTFLVTNLACFLLKISSAPNFRPSFHYFNWETAAFGTLISGISMFFVDGFYATGCVGLLIAIFLVIHYTTPPKSWGDVSQSLIYHQVRKYLLRLRQEHVKFWRPQVLLLINDPRRQYKLIQFCNALKKGALFVLGHVIVSDDFGGSVPEARKQQAAWMKYIDVSRVKAFIDVAIAPSLEWGARNLLMNAGLGGMRPNIIVIGMYNLDLFRAAQPLIDTSDIPRTENDNGRRDSEIERMKTPLPTDENRQERDITPAAWITILEDLLFRLKINVAVAKGFSKLALPSKGKSTGKKYIDLWPIQMSAQIAAEEGSEKQNVLTTNFDTYTMILQLGCVLHTVPKWRRAYKLRVAVFVEYEVDVKDERSRLQALLSRLRIEAEILVFWLACGDIKSYQVVVNGDYDGSNASAADHVDQVLKEEDWWQEMQVLRGRVQEPAASEQLVALEEEFEDVQAITTIKRRSSKFNSLSNLRQFVRSLSRRRSTSNVPIGPRLSMTTQRLDDGIVSGHAIYNSASESSDSDEYFDLENSDSETDTNGIHVQLSNVDDGLRGRSARKVPSRSQSDESVPKAKPEPLERRVSERFKENERSPLTPSEPARTPKTLTIPNTPGSAPLKTPLSIHSARSVDSRPRPSRRSSAAKFSSHPVPETAVSTDDGPGPSIMFAEPARMSPRKRSIYDRGFTPSASGFPSPLSVPLSFNDLPARAQHLILNELMRQHSAETAVVFTTLPSPEEGTCKSDEESVGYLSDLEVLCKDLPPVMLVQSNNITVTVNI